MQKTHLVSISTDASVSDQHRVGGWAFWLRIDHTDIKKSGRVRGGVRDSTEAELMCMVNAISVLDKMRGIYNCQVVINTDSQAAIRMLTGGNYKGVFASYIRYLENMLTRAQKYHFLHIKAHKKGGSLSLLEAHNRWCDRHARKHMVKAIKEVKKREEDNRRRAATHTRRPYYPNKQRQVVTDRRMARRGIVPYKRAKRDFSKELHHS